MQVLEKVEHGELRLGGKRPFDHSHLPEFQLLLHVGDRLIIGLNVEDLMPAPFIRLWLGLSSFRAAYEGSLTDDVKKKRKLNLARWALRRALIITIREYDRTVVIISQHRPLADDDSQVFIEGSIFCLAYSGRLGAIISLFFYRYQKL